MMRHERAPVGPGPFPFAAETHSQPWARNMPSRYGRSEGLGCHDHAD